MTYFDVLKHAAVRGTVASVVVGLGIVIVQHGWDTHGMLQAAFTFVGIAVIGIVAAFAATMPWRKSLMAQIENGMSWRGVIAIGGAILGAWLLIGVAVGLSGHWAAMPAMAFIGAVSAIVGVLIADGVIRRFRERRPQ